MPGVRVVLLRSSLPERSGAAGQVRVAGDPGFSHPRQDEAWWADVQSAFPDAASRVSRTLVVGKRAQRFDHSAAPALLRLAVPAT
jgi:hypothetical protein